MAFVCLVEVELHFPEGTSLKGKRKEIVSLKSQIQRRFGASVAETGHHELWQRSRLTVAVVGRDAAVAQDTASALERHIRSRFPDGVSFERALVSADEVIR